MYTLNKRVWGARRPKDKVTSQIIFVFTFTWPMYMYKGRVSVKKINIYTLQQDKCKCNFFLCVSVNDHDLHIVYTAIDIYMHNNGSTTLEYNIVHMVFEQKALSVILKYWTLVRPSCPLLI